MDNSSHSLSVSIVVPIYGASAYIGQCAESLLSQTYPNIEFVFVDDGTKDNSIDILRSVVALHPERKSNVIIVEKENQGVVLARKTGMSHAKGDYVIQIDADDWVETNMIDSMVNVILATGADLVYTDYFLEFPDRQAVAIEKEYSDLQELFKDLYNGKNFHGYYWNKLVRRSLYATVRVWPQYAMREDLVVVSQLISHAERVVHLPQPFCHYRICTAGSITNSKISKQKYESARNLMALFDHYHNLSIGDNSRSPILGVDEDLLQRIGWFAFGARDFAIFRQYPYLKKLLKRIVPSKKYDLNIIKQWALNLATRMICVK